MRYVAGVAGAAIGFWVGGPTGASIGWTVGMAAGTMLWPPTGPTIEGPRMADREMQVSEYGAPKSLVYGRYRLAGNVIWATDIQEVRSEERVGGGKGGGGGATQVSYSYFANFSVAVCEGTSRQIVRVWADTKLIYEDTISNIQRAKYPGVMTFYTGAEDQQPSPLMELYEGVGNVPAYRGIVRIDFNRLPLKDFGNRIPQISVEVDNYVDAAPLPWVRSSTYNVWWPLGYPSADSRYLYTRVQDPSDLVGHLETPKRKLGRIDLNSMEVTTVMDPRSHSEALTGLDFDLIGVGSLGHVWTRWGIPSTLGNTYRYMRHDPVSLAVLQNMDVDDALGETFIYGPHAYVTVGGADILCSFGRTSRTVGAGTNSVQRLDTRDKIDLAGEWNQSIGGTFYRTWDLIGGAGYLWLLANGQGSARAVALYRIDPVDMSMTEVTPWADDTLFSASCPGQLGWDHENNRLLILAHSSQTWDRAAGGTGPAMALGSMNPATNTLVWSRTVPGNYLFNGDQRQSLARNAVAAGAVWYGIVGTYNTGGGYPGTVDGSNVQEYLLLDANTGDLLATYDRVGSSSDWVHAQWVHIPYSNRTITGRSVLGLDGYGNGFNIRDLNTPPTAAGIPLQTIVADICRRSDVPLESVNTTGLGSTVVHGYMIGRQASGRSALEPLMAVYNFYAVESDGILKFRYNSETAAGAIDPDHLGAAGEGTQVSSLLEELRRQEVELPRRVTLTYADAALMYQANSQSMSRKANVVKAIAEHGVNVPVALSALEAKQVVDRMLRQAWVHRTTYSLLLPPQYIRYDAGDVLEVPLGGNLYRLRIDDMSYGANGALEVEASAVKQITYTAGPATFVGSTPVNRPAPVVDYIFEATNVLMFDGPLLRMEDDHPGIYIAARGETTSWPGAVAYRSSDDASYSRVATLTQPAPLGVLLAPLASQPSTLVDRVSTVTIRLPSFVTLASCTEEEMLNGTNPMLIGDELIYFSEATQTGASGGNRTWELNTLLRGMAGTEWASTHSSGDRVLLLATDGSILDIPTELASLGLDRYYRVPTINQALEEAPLRTFTPAFRRLMPLSPAHLQGTRDGDDLTITWVRRSRYATGWADGIEEAPLDELAVQFRVQIMDGVDVARTWVTSDEEVLYTEAQQVADFGSAQGAVTVIVQQYSDRVGYGYPAEETV